MHAALLPVAVAVLSHELIQQRTRSVHAVGLCQRAQGYLFAKVAQSVSVLPRLPTDTPATSSAQAGQSLAIYRLSFACRQSAATLFIGRLRALHAASGRSRNWLPWGRWAAVHGKLAWGDAAYSVQGGFPAGCAPAGGTAEQEAARTCACTRTRLLFIAYAGCLGAVALRCWYWTLVRTSALPRCNTLQHFYQVLLGWLYWKACLGASRPLSVEPFESCQAARLKVCDPKRLLSEPHFIVKCLLMSDTPLCNCNTAAINMRDKFVQQQYGTHAGS